MAAPRATFPHLRRFSSLCRCRPQANAEHFGPELPFVEGGSRRVLYPASNKASTELQVGALQVGGLAGLLGKYLASCDCASIVAQAPFLPWQCMPHLLASALLLLTRDSPLPVCSLLPAVWPDCPRL
jgi:hypothetical protein